MEKVNLSSKTLVEGVVLTKNSRKGYLEARYSAAQGTYSVSIDNGIETEIEVFENIKDITKKFDARNWNTIMLGLAVVPNSPIEEVEEDEWEYESRAVDKIDENSDLNVAKEFNAIIAENDESGQISDDIHQIEVEEKFLELKLEEKKIITTTGTYSDLSKSAMFRLLSELGIKTSEIAKMTNSHYSFVFGTLKRSNHTTNQTQGVGHPTKTEQIILLFEQGKSGKEISTELNAHPSFVYNTIRKYKMANNA